jgi:hypothetical protein
MSNQIKVIFLKNSEIDYEKWDACVNSANNESLYAQSWYLDVVCPGWEAMVYDNYRFVMPLSVKRKLGFRYVSQPYFAQQLGIFPTPEIALQKCFADELAQKFKFINYQLNWKMNPDAFSQFQISTRTNLVLNLEANYEELYMNYTDHTKRSLKRAKREKVTVLSPLPKNDYLLNIESKYKVPNSAIKQLDTLMSLTLSRGNGKIYGAYSDNNSLCAAGFFLQSGRRILYLNAFSTKAGRENRAMYALVDQFVKDHVNKPLKLDFEGSNNEGLARFYGGFGAYVENYYHIYRQQLPFILKWLK